MKRQLLFSLVLAGTATLVGAAEPLNPLSFADGKIVVVFQERLRLEMRENNFDFNAGART